MAALIMYHSTTASTTTGQSLDLSFNSTGTAGGVRSRQRKNADS